MKKSVKVICLIAGICIALGVCIAFGASVKIGFDFEKLNTVTMETKTYTVEEPFENITIDSNALDVYFEIAEDAQCKVVCTETERNVCTVSVEDNTLTVAQTDTRLWYETFGVFWNSDEAEMRITVYLPKQQYQALRVRSQSGTVSVGPKFAFATAEAETESGNILFSGTVNETLTANSNSGDLYLKNLTAQNITAKTDSGCITLDTVKTEHMLRLMSESGIVRLADTLAGTFFCETESGDIQLQDFDADTLEMHSDSGSVTGNLLSEKDFEISTNSGTADVPPCNKNGGRCAITTASGDISLAVSNP